MLINYDDHDNDDDHDDDCASANVWHPSADNVGNLRLIPAHPTITVGKPAQSSKLDNKPSKKPHNVVFSVVGNRCKDKLLKGSTVHCKLC